MKKHNGQKKSMKLKCKCDFILKMCHLSSSSFHKYTFMGLQLVQDESEHTGRTNSHFIVSQSQMCHSHASCSCCVSQGSLEASQIPKCHAMALNLVINTPSLVCSKQCN